MQVFYIACKGIGRRLFNCFFSNFFQSLNKLWDHFNSKTIEILYLEIVYFFFLNYFGFSLYLSCHWYFHFAWKLMTASENDWNMNFKSLSIQCFTEKKIIYEQIYFKQCKNSFVNFTTETGVFLIPLNLYLFSSLFWNILPALWPMYKEELFKIQLEEGQFKISHQRGWFPTDCQWSLHVCI